MLLNLLSSGIALALVSLLLGLIAYQYNKQRHRTRSQGAILLHAIRNLIKNLQIHRGLMSQQYSGAAHHAKKLASQKASISRNIHNIVNLSPKLENDPDWLGITSHWARLSTNTTDKHGDTENFDQHCKIIASTMKFMLDQADQHKLLHNSWQQHTPPSWYTLLEFTELLGQLRANGIRFLALNHADNNLCTRRIKKGMQELLDMLVFPTIRVRLNPEHAKTILEFTEFIKLHLIGKKGLITEELYFSEATRVIDIAFDYLDEDLQALHKESYQ